MSFTSIGFVVDDLSSGQIPYTLTKSANEFLEKNFDVNINVFFQDNYMPCVEPKFARFNIKDAFCFDGHLIATSLSTAKIIRNFTRSKRYYYIYDPTMLAPPIVPEKWSEVYPLMSDHKIKKFCRSQDHFNLVSPLTETDDTIVEDFDMEKIVRIINK